MKLSAPLYSLKRQARVLSRTMAIPLHEALDRIAAREGFPGWSLLAARAEAASPAVRSLALLLPGDLALVGARPGQGKTLFGLELAVEAMKRGCRSVFFTLEYTARDVATRFHAIGADCRDFGSLFEFDDSEAISADYIVAKLKAAAPGTLAVIDYLQLLDQNREKPDLSSQVRALKGFALSRGLIMVFLSQIDRAYDLSGRDFPDMGDIRLPNPLDTALFDKAFFLSNGKVRFGAGAG